MTKETKQAFDDRFAREMTEAAEGMRKVGVIDDVRFKLSMRQPDRAALDEMVLPLAGADIKRRDRRVGLTVELTDEWIEAVQNAEVPKAFAFLDEELK